MDMSTTHAALVPLGALCRDVDVSSESSDININGWQWIELSSIVILQRLSQKNELLQVARECQRECRRSAMLSQKTMKDAATRARRLSKEMQAYWKRFDKVEKEHRRKAEKEAMEQRKMDMEFREVLYCVCCMQDLLT